MLSKKTLETAIEALEYFKKVNYCWSTDKHPKYDRCMDAIEELKKNLEELYLVHKKA